MVVLLTQSMLLIQLQNMTLTNAKANGGKVDGNATNLQKLKAANC